METENFIRVYDNIFTPEHCKELIDIFENNAYVWSHQKEDKVDNELLVQNENDNERKDKAIFLQDLERGNMYLNQFYNALDAPLRNYCSTFPILEDINFASYTVKLQKTEPRQGYHKWHCEKSGFEVRTRLLVWTVYLNDIAEGGETEFLYQAKRYKPKQGSVMFFPAGFTHNHRGNPPLEQTKYIATGWYTLNPA